MRAPQESFSDHIEDEPWLIADDGLPKTEEGGFQHVTYDTVNWQQLWDDTLMMSVLPRAKIGLLLDRPHYVEEAKRQFLVIRRRVLAANWKMNAAESVH